MANGAGIGKPTSEETLRSLLTQLGREVDAARARLGWTQAQAAHYADVSTSTYVTLELGKGNPTFRTVVKVATAFGLPLPKLLSDAMEQGNPLQ